jgi:mitotic spindle assembly checkpoint protein MAD2
MASKSNSKSEITLRGSTAIVTEFFGFAVNSILYQRGLYEADSFKQIQKYGLIVTVSRLEAVNNYIAQVMNQIHVWLLTNDVEKLILAISGEGTKQVLERWVFNISTTDSENTAPGQPQAEKTEKEIQKDIAYIVRQIVQSVTFLPMLDEPCTYEFLVYVRKEAQVPQNREWVDSDPRFVSNSIEVKFRSFSTNVHQVESMVSYRAQE